MLFLPVGRSGLEFLHFTASFMYRMKEDNTLLSSVEQCKFID